MIRPTLIVEDDEDLRVLLQRSFRDKGWSRVYVPSVQAAREALRSTHLDFALVDLRLADGSGMEVLREARELNPEIVVVLMSTYGNVPAAIDAIREGAADLLLEPFRMDDLERALERALETRDLRRRVALLERERERRVEVGAILGESPAIRRVCEGIGQAVGSPTPVLVVGETGTGAEYLRRAVELVRKPPVRIHPELEAVLLAYSWPGKVRELKTVMERAAILNGTEQADPIPRVFPSATGIEGKGGCRPGAHTVRGCPLSQCPSQARSPMVQSNSQHGSERTWDGIPSVCQEESPWPLCRSRLFST